jgi:hypothetical protein
MRLKNPALIEAYGSGLIGPRPPLSKGRYAATQGILSSGALKESGAPSLNTLVWFTLFLVGNEEFLAFAKDSVN